MLKLSLRNLLVNKLRLFLTVAAVTVGVAFVAGTFVLSDTTVKAFGELYSGLTSDTDVIVRSEPAYDADITATGGALRPMDEDVVATVRSVEGVEVAEGAVSGFAVVIDASGEAVVPNGAPTIGTSISADRALDGETSFREGGAPSGGDEVALDARTVQAAGYQLGDPVDVVFQNGRETFTLVGIIGFGDTDSLLGATLAGFDLRTAQRVLDKVGVLDEVDIAAAEGVGAADLRDRIAAALPEGVEALTGAQAASEGTAAVDDALGTFTTVLLVFAGVSLLVGSFVIWNTFNVLVAQRRREVALMRAVGATRRQVLSGVLIEAVLIGLVSGVLGLLVGIGLATGITSVLDRVGLEIPATAAAVEPRTIVAAMGVGLVITTIAALTPAWSATRVAPMEALRPVEAVGGAVGRRRVLAGWVVSGLGLAGLAATAIIGNQRWWTVIATGLAFAGLVLLGPVLARGMARLADHGRRGSGWRMAARNIARNSRRSAATAMALTIGLTVVAAVTVTASSLKESVAESVAGGNRSDLILSPAGAGIGISPSVAELLRSRDDVDTVVELRESVARVNDKDALVTGLDTAGLDQVIDLGIENGSLADLATGTMLVDATAAEELGVVVGDTLTVTYPESGEKTVQVVGTFGKGQLINATYVVPLADFAANYTSQLDANVLMTHVPGTDPVAAKATIQAAVADYPNVTVNDPADITREVQAGVDQLLGMVTAMLLLAVIVAIFGIVNTLVLSVVERAREFGMMRAVGATRRQVRTVVRRESVLMAMLGALTGIGLGTVAGIALSRALVDEGIITLTVPTVTLALYLLAAAGVGVLAAIGPARRAGKVDVLESITAE